MVHVRGPMIRACGSPSRLSSDMRVHALVLAGGSGDRFGAEMPKQFVRLAGEPILLRSIRAIARRRASTSSSSSRTRAGWRRRGRSSPTPRLTVQPAIVVGGTTRNESTRNGLAALTGASDDDIVVIHDAVRPLVPPR